MKAFSTSSMNQILKTYRKDRDSLIFLLQNIQNTFGFLPREALRHVSEKCDIPLSKLFSVATFYNSFSLEPRGRKLISACLGTACHVKGGENLFDMISRTLGLDGEEGTTPDGAVTLTKVRCLGCCSIAPVVKVDDDIHGYMTQKEISTIVKKQ